MAKKADGSLGDFSVAVTFPKVNKCTVLTTVRMKEFALSCCQVHLTDVIGMGMAATGKFIATCNDKTELLVWNLKGEVWVTKKWFQSRV